MPRVYYMEYIEVTGKPQPASRASPRRRIITFSDITFSDILFMGAIWRRTHDHGLDPRFIGPRHPDPDEPGGLAETRIRPDQGHRRLRGRQAGGRHPVRRSSQAGAVGLVEALPADERR